MNKRSYRGAIVGAGNIGKVQLTAFKGNASVKMIGIYDVNQTQAKAVAAEYQITAYEDLDSLLEEVDFVVICTPPKHRVELFRRAVEAKVAVLLEKPLAADYTSAQEIAALQKAAGTPVGVGFCHRFVPAVQKILEYKMSGDFGALRALSQAFIGGPGSRILKDSWMSEPALSGGGVVLDTLCHSIDLTQYLGGHYVREGASLQRSWPGRGETAALIHATTDEGVLVDLIAAWDYPATRFDLRATFEKAEVYYNYKDQFITVQHETDPTPSQESVVGFGGRFASQAEAFVGLLEGRCSPLCSVEEALSVSRVTEAIYSSR